MYNEHIKNAIRIGVVTLKVTVLLLFAWIVIHGMIWGLNKSVEKYNTYMTASSISLKERERELQCLTQNIYWEAASEPFEGKVAVAQVTLNRAAHEKFPKDVCKVVYQKNVVYDRVICQFSWFCENNFKVKPVHKEMYAESEAVAKKVLLEGFRLDGLKDALYYHADYVNPRWNKPRVGKIGRHIFYKES